MLFEIVLQGLPIDRDEVEDALEDEFAADGEVTGAGTGMGRCHLDLETDNGLDPQAALDRIGRVLDQLGIREFARVNPRG